MLEFLKADIIDEDAEYMQVELRMLHVPTGKYIGRTMHGDVGLVDSWKHAMYYGTAVHVQAVEMPDEMTFEFQWAFLQDGYDMSEFNQEEFRVHVLLGETGL